MFSVRLRPSARAIIGNSITGNKNMGILLGSSSNNIINGNIIRLTTYSDGIGLYDSSNHNSVSGNNITNNHNGIYLEFSLDNRIARIGGH